MAIIRMRDHLYDEIVNYAKEHLPEEACGLLAGVENGEGREIRKVYFLENKIMQKITSPWIPETR